MKRLSLLLLTSILVVTGCGNKSEATNSPIYADNGSKAYYEVCESDYYDAESYDAGNMSDYEFNAEAAANSSASLQSRKLITTANYSVETEDYDQFSAGIETRVSELGGYIENSSCSTGYHDLRRASYTIRIPEANFDAFTSLVTENSNVTSKSTSVEDVTLSYVDIEARKAVYVAEEERLLEFLNKADDIDTIITIETRLSEVQATIESMEATLRSYDNLCNYSTIYLSVNEVEVYTVIETKETTVWEKISIGFNESLSQVGNGFVNFGIWFITSIPFIIVWVIILLIIVFVIKKIKRKLNLRPETKKAESEASASDSAKDEQ